MRGDGDEPMVGIMISLFERALTVIKNVIVIVTCVTILAIVLLGWSVVHQLGERLSE